MAGKGKTTKAKYSPPIPGQQDARSGGTQKPIPQTARSKSPGAGQNVSGKGRAKAKKSY